MQIFYCMNIRFKTNILVLISLKFIILLNFPMPDINVNIMAIIGRAKPIMAKMVIMGGVMARPIMVVILTFMDVPGKYAQNVDHR